jgi:2-polyprenyl-3-methyl-5-hydroxy-6-metoxy-1,4-benzoquinol methylase
MMSDPHLFYDTIAHKFDSLMNRYDLERRLAVVFDELLPPTIAGLRMLDLGCGSGWFSQRAVQIGADVVSVDISNSLVRTTNSRAGSRGVVGDAARLSFASGCFELIVCSEMLEHLEEPEWGIRELARVLASRGTLVLTTPNRRWLWLVTLATRTGLRPYGGHERFLGFDELRRQLEEVDLEVEVHCGFHPWPFQLRRLQPLSRWVDRHYGSGPWGQWMINQAVRARKS